MNLYLLRHAKSEPRSDIFKPDRKRPISLEGEKIMRKAAEAMLESGLDLDLIITSPYVRTLQTAQILAKVYATDKLWTSPNLAVEGDQQKLIGEINDNYPSLQNIILVGHEPFLSTLMSTLLTGTEGLEVDFKKSGLAKLAIEDLRYGKCAKLEWLLTPRQLQRLK